MLVRNNPLGSHGAVWREHLFQVNGWCTDAGFCGYGQDVCKTAGSETTTQYPELQALTDLISGPTAILDGEVVAFHQGRVSFPSVLRRDQANRPEYIALLMEQMPVTYILFDLLYLDGKDLTGQPLLERHSLLADILSPHPQIVTTDNFAVPRCLLPSSSGWKEWWQVKNSLIFPARTITTVKIKLRQQQLCVVGGYTTRGSLPMPVSEPLINRARYLGRVGSGCPSSKALPSAAPAELHQTRSPLLIPRLPTGSFTGSYRFLP